MQEKPTSPSSQATEDPTEELSQLQTVDGVTPLWYPWFFDPQPDGIFMLTEVDPGIKRFLPYTDNEFLIDEDLGIDKDDALDSLQLQSQ